MAKSGWKPDEGWKRLKMALDPGKMDKEIRKQLRRATKRNAKLVEAAIRKEIRKGNFERNAALTVAIKDSTKPLVDRGQLFQFVTSKTFGDSTLFVGVLRTDENYNIAAALHEGSTATVTPKMRGLFFVLWQASIGEMSPAALTGRAAELFERMPQGWLPLKAGTKFIVNPPRPFIEQAIKDAGLKEKIAGNWKMAIAEAVKQRALSVGGKTKKL